MSNTPVKSAENFLQNKSRFVVNDLASGTGLSVFDAQIALDELLKKYHCRLLVTDLGEIIYDFGNLLRRGEKTSEEIRAELYEKMWAAFKTFFRIWIAFTLLTYFIVFFIVLLIVIIVQIVALFSDDSGGDADFGIGDAVGGIFRLFAEVFYWNTVVDSTHYSTDLNGYQSLQYDSRPHTISKKKEGKNFVSSVYDFVFGMPRVKHDDLAFQKEIAAYIQKNKGILSLTEVKFLNGTQGETADKLFSDVISRFEGTPEVSENGVLYAQFDKFMTKTQENKEKIIWFWDEFEPEYLLTGNSTGKNALVVSLNLFNLIFAFVGLSGFYSSFFGIPDAAWLRWLAGYIPLIFSVIFFAVPLIRSFSLAEKNQKRLETNRRKRVLRVISRMKGIKISLQSLGNELSKQNIQEIIASDELKKILAEIAIDFRAETVLNSKTGELEYDFSEMQRELRTAANLRAKRGGNNSPGEVVFDTQEP